MYVIGTLLWSLTFVAAGILTPLQIAQAMLSPLLMVFAGVLIAVSLAYFNYSTLPNLQSGRTKGVLNGFFYWEMLFVLLYGTIGPICGLSFHQWSSGPLTMTGIFLGIAACFVFGYPFFLKALEALEWEFAEKTFTSDVSSGISLVFKMGIPLSLMIISDITVIITVSNILSGLAVQDILQRLLYVAVILILFSLSTIYFSMRSLKNTLAPLVGRLKEAEDGHANLALRLPVVTSDELGRISSCSTACCKT
jgi:predicted membrane channel-forming protein YqfA (hemolysin III family)